MRYTPILRPLNYEVKAPSLLASFFLALKDGKNAIQFSQLVLSRDPNNKQAKNALLEASKI